MGGKQGPPGKSGVEKLAGQKMAREDLMLEKKTKQDDARYQAAEQKIRDAFYALLQERGVQNTTVRMIVERAGINRSTFYLHYQDKYDLLHAIEE